MEKVEEIEKQQVEEEETTTDDVNAQSSESNILDGVGVEKDFPPVSTTQTRQNPLSYSLQCSVIWRVLKMSLRYTVKILVFTTAFNVFAYSSRAQDAWILHDVAGTAGSIISTEHLDVGFQDESRLGISALADQDRHPTVCVGRTRGLKGPSDRGHRRFGVPGAGDIGS